MNKLLPLLRLDLLRIRNWFRAYSGVKLLVLLGFFLVLTTIVAAEFLMADSFFSLTSTQKEFGKAVTQYSISAALLVLFLLAVMSSITGSSRALYRPGFLGFLHTVPISSDTLFISRLMTALWSSTWMIILFLTPLLAAYGRNFPIGSQFLLRCLTVLVLIALTSHTIGTTVIVILVQLLGKITRKMLVAIFVFFIGGAIVLIRFLFPPAFFRLYYAADWPSFQRQLGELPLLSYYLPSNWLASTVTDGWSSSTLAALLLAIASVSISLWIGGKYYVVSWRSEHEDRFLANKKIPFKKPVSHFPKPGKSPFKALLTNEFLAVFRATSETAYLAFLLGLTIIFLYLMRNIPALSQTHPEFIPAVQTLSLFGLSYLLMTLTARLVYPLMAREKRFTWLLFSIPIRRELLLAAKIVFALIMAIPALAIGWLAAGLAGFSQTLTLSFTSFLFVTAAVVSLIQLFFGTIAPNFVEADNLEATSTSGSGLAAITMSLLFITLTGITFYAVSTRILTGAIGILTILTVSLLLILPLWIFAQRNIYTYDI